MDVDRKTRRFTCRYYHDGAWWSVNIDAYDLPDAEVRVKKLGNMILDGELISTGPAWLLPFVRAYCWIKNHFL